MSVAAPTRRGLLALAAGAAAAPLLPAAVQPFRVVDGLDNLCLEVAPTTRIVATDFSVAEHRLLAYYACYGGPVWRERLRDFVAARNRLTPAWELYA